MVRQGRGGQNHPGTVPQKKQQVPSTRMLAFFACDMMTASFFRTWTDEKENHNTHTPRCDIPAVPDAAGYCPGFHGAASPGRAAGHLRPQHTETGIRLVR